MRTALRIVPAVILIASLASMPSQPAQATTLAGTVTFTAVVAVGPPGLCAPGLGPVGPACVPLAPTPAQPFVLGPPAVCVFAGTAGAGPCFVAAGGMIGPVGLVGPHCTMASGDSFGPPADFIVTPAVVYPFGFGFLAVGNHIFITGSVTDAGHDHPFTGTAHVIGVVGAAPPPAVPCITTPAVAYTLLVTATVSGL